MEKQSSNCNCTGPITYIIYAVAAWVIVFWLLGVQVSLRIERVEPGTGLEAAAEDAFNKSITVEPYSKRIEPSNDINRKE